jgi:hypothetical protein
MHELSELSAKSFNVNLGTHVFSTENDSDILLVHNIILAKLLDIREASVNLSTLLLPWVSKYLKTVVPYFPDNS